jgi:hypothetical protein
MSATEQNGTEMKSVIIANPIYDTVFKKLMENTKIAKFFLSTILERQIIDITVRPQEFSYRNDGKKNQEDIPYSMFRIDFMATV